MAGARLYGFADIAASDIDSGRQLDITMHTCIGGKRLAIVYTAGTIEVIDLHQFTGFQLLLFVGLDESCPRHNLAVQRLYRVVPGVGHIFGIVDGVGVFLSEVYIPSCQFADIDWRLLLIGKALCIVARSRIVQEHIVTLANQVRNQLLHNIVLRMDEGGVDFRRELHHLVADEVDGVLLRLVPATRQYFSGSRHLVFMTVHCRRAA